MKKILISLLCLGGLLLSSCDMDHMPAGQITDEDALQSAQDCFNFRNNFYGDLRALSTGGYISYTEMQMDQFIGTTINGNRLGEINNGVILSSNPDITGIFGGLYGGIASCNFFLKRAVPVREKEDLTVEDQQNIDRYIAECYFTRAFFYFWLLDHFCPAYNDVNKDRLLGLPLVTKYEPTAKKGGYPSRSTLAETYTFIEKDLDLAYNGLKAFEQSDNEAAGEALRQESPFLNTYIVRCLQARLALLKGDWENAEKYAAEVVDSNRFPLCGRRSYGSMWTDDTGTEIIFRPSSTAEQLGISSTGMAWYGGTGEYTADYVPVGTLATPDLPASLYLSNDIRYTTFVGQRQLLIDGSFIKAPIFTKFPGNDALNLSGPRLVNMPKVFRTSELVLIIAEAAYQQGKAEVANAMLNDLRSKRLSNYTEQTYSGEELYKEIKKERLRELIGEGFRMSDLRRWGEGFPARDHNYPNFPGLDVNLVDAGKLVTYAPGDYRLTWPIPASELNVNPHMQGQQNPGYPGSSY